MCVDYLYESDDEFEKFVQTMNPPQVVIDNQSSPNATVVKVDSANKNGILLEVVQVLIDLNLLIAKAYVILDGGWFMDVFNVTDRDGNKLTNQTTINEIEDIIRKSLGADSSFRPSKRRSVDVATSADRTVIELTGNDRPGLLSEISAVLADLNCNLVNIEMWSHNTRVASVIHVQDQTTNLPVTDSEILGRIKERLNNVLKGDNVTRKVRTNVLVGGMNNMERTLHKLMCDDDNGDFESDEMDGQDDQMMMRPVVTVNNWNDSTYSVVTIRCKDRSKLLFDTVCTLTHMKYVIFHANIEAQGTQAYQEFYIKHMDGRRVEDEERERVIHCLEAAIQRRVSEGLKLELVSPDKVGLLSKVTRIFREHSLTVTRAEVSTRDGTAISTFYVKDNSGNNIVEPKIIDNIRNEINKTLLDAKAQIETQNSLVDNANINNVSPKRSPIKFLSLVDNANINNVSPKRSPIKFLFGGLFKAMSLYNFGFVG
ncbi:hypothetical protein LUZ60_010112 [Juncus effusus]|nr:hypothetical protein LUZ60_010112 [Juncus effusus]